MATSTLIDVARALREPLEDESMLPLVALTRVTDADTSTVIKFIEQARAHQKVVQHAESSKVFKGKVLEVKYLTRESNGKAFGKKAVIVLQSPTKDGEREEIETGWVEYWGETDPAKVSDDRTIWEMAMSRSIEIDALALVGKHVLVRKVVRQLEGTQKKIRYIAGIWINHAEERNSGGGTAGGSRGADDRAPRRDRSGGASDEVTVDTIKDACSTINVKFGSDLEDLLAVKNWSGSVDDVSERVAKAAQFRGKDVDEFMDVFADHKGSMLERAILTLAEWRD